MRGTREEAAVRETTLRALQIDRIKAKRIHGVWTAEIIAAGVSYQANGPTHLCAVGLAVDAAQNDQRAASLRDVARGPVT